MAATTPTSATSSSCSTTTRPTRPTTASCRPWPAPARTSTTSLTTSTRRSIRPRLQRQSHFSPPKNSPRASNLPCPVLAISFCRKGGKPQKPRVRIVVLSEVGALHQRSRGTRGCSVVAFPERTHPQPFLFPVPWVEFHRQTPSPFATLPLPLPTEVTRPHAYPFASRLYVRHRRHRVPHPACPVPATYCGRAEHDLRSQGSRRGSRLPQGRRED